MKKNGQAGWNFTFITCFCSLCLVEFFFFLSLFPYLFLFLNFESRCFYFFLYFFCFFHFLFCCLLFVALGNTFHQSLFTGSEPVTSTVVSLLIFSIGVDRRNAEAHFE